MGGLAGHMMHPHDNLDLTIEDFGNLIRSSLKGELGMTEKFDGFNIHILNKGGEIRFARNAKDLETAGFGLDDMENRFSNERVREIFREGFKMACVDSRFDRIPDWDLFKYTVNVEIIVGTTNIMPYDGFRMIIPHNLYRWMFDGKRHIITSIEDLRGGFKSDLPLKNINPMKRYNELYWNARMDEIFKDTCEGDKLEDYYRMKFQDVVEALMGIHEPELVNTMFNRFFDRGVKLNLREIRKIYGEAVQEFLDKQKALVYLTKSDLDKFVLEAGTHILEGVKGLNALGENQFTAPGKLYQEIKKVEGSETSLKIFYDRWEACDKKIFPIEGVVVNFKGHSYKWTGPFAPINRLIGGNL